MASVKLNGDTSGFIEISAPNVAGSTTITLPATSGGNFLVTDSNGDLNVDSGTLFVDASENRIGVGTTSPTAALNVSTGSTDLSADFVGTGSPYIRIDNGTKKYIAQVTGSDFRIQDQSASAECLRIDSSNRLLVGRTSSQNENIAGTGYANLVQIEGNATGEGLSVANSAAAARINITRDLESDSITNGMELGFISFGAESPTSVERARIQCNAAFTAANERGGALQFYTCANGSANPTERMRISNQGYFMVDSDGQGHHVAVAASAGTSTEIFIGAHTSTGLNGGTTSFKVWSNGNVVNTNNSYGSLSDQKLKENIVDAGSQWDDLKAIQIRKYNFKAETNQPTHTQLGVIAQEVEVVSPGLVSESPDVDEEGNDLGTVTKSVNYSVLYMKAVKALQEAITRIETLETANASLEARLTALEGGN